MSQTLEPSPHCVGVRLQVKKSLSIHLTIMSSTWVGVRLQVKKSLSIHLTIMSSTWVGISMSRTGLSLNPEITLRMHLKKPHWCNRLQVEKGLVSLCLIILLQPPGMALHCQWRKVLMDHVTDPGDQPTCLSADGWPPSSCPPAITHSTSWASRVTKEWRLPSTLGRRRLFLEGLAALMPIMKGLAVVREEKSTVSTITWHSSSKYSKVAASCHRQNRNQVSPTAFSWFTLASYYIVHGRYVCHLYVKIYFPLQKKKKEKKKRRYMVTKIPGGEYRFYLQLTLTTWCLYSDGQ